MDELDLLLDTLDTTAPEGATVVKAEDPDEFATLALEEFTSASNPKDKLEALRLLVRLMGK